MHVGAAGYEDYTTHHDDNRRRLYPARHAKWENWGANGCADGRLAESLAAVGEALSEGRHRSGSQNVSRRQISSFLGPPFSPGSPRLVLLSAPGGGSQADVELAGLHVEPVAVVPPAVQPPDVLVGGQEVRRGRLAEPPAPIHSTLSIIHCPA